MHSLIEFVVEAEDEEDALANAEMYFSESMGNIRGMDYFSLLAEDEDARKRWEIDEPVYEIDDNDDTLIHIDELIQINRDEIEKHLKKAMELYEKQPKGWGDNIFYHLRAASGGNYYGGVLFHYEDPIISWSQIDRLKRDLPEGLKLYVVLVDIHH